VLRDLDNRLVPAVAYTRPTRGGQRHRRHRERDLRRRRADPGRGCHIDRAYLASHLVRDRGPELAIYCKAWRVRNAAGHYAKTDFALNFTTRQLTLPRRA